MLWKSPRGEGSWLLKSEPTTFWTRVKLTLSRKSLKLTDGGADVCFEVTGVETAFNAAIESSRVNGQVVIVSVWEGPASISPNSLVLKEREIRGILAYRDIFPAVIKLIAEGTFRLDGLITREIPLSATSRPDIKGSYLGRFIFKKSCQKQWS
ncbi:Zinc-binding dehydrogenase [Planifilum fulgidum]|uniref:Zinc-binding dehydrogenase n=1 Tax=Planifilum fulgidum TaxID=201973 RepID=A0A1I2TDB1_9BACL|nr:Zinc-binding dehydrogenase [Planifilum fulgidum]